MARRRDSQTKEVVSDAADAPMFFPSSDIAGGNEPELSLNVISARDQHEVLPYLFQWSNVIMSCSPLSNFPITRTYRFRKAVKGSLSEGSRPWLRGQSSVSWSSTFVLVTR